MQSGNLPARVGHPATSPVIPAGNGASNTGIHEWQEIRRKVWRKKLPERQTQRPVHALVSTTALFKERAKGRCYCCLARDHKVTDCRDQHPLLCLRSPCSPLPLHPSSRLCHPHIAPPTSPSTMPPHCFALHDRAKPGLPSRRADRYEACAAYSAEMAATEND
jgi:hypothetical protein